MTPREIDRDIKLVWRLMNAPDHDLCASLNHNARDQHGYAEPCPVASRVVAAWTRLAQHLTDEMDPLTKVEP